MMPDGNTPTEESSLPYTVVQVSRVFPAYNYGGSPLAFSGWGPTFEEAEANLELELEKILAALKEG